MLLVSAETQSRNHYVLSSYLISFVYGKPYSCYNSIDLLKWSEIGYEKLRYWNGGMASSTQFELHSKSPLLHSLSLYPIPSLIFFFFEQEPHVAQIGWTFDPLPPKYWSCARKCLWTPKHNQGAIRVFLLQVWVWALLQHNLTHQDRMQRLSSLEPSAGQIFIGK